MEQRKERTWRLRTWTAVAALSILTGGVPADAATASVRLGLPLHEPAALFHVAADQDHFGREGLKATVREYGSGVQALQNGLFAGEADIVATTDVPFVTASLLRDDFTILASIGTMDNFIQVAVRAASGIRRPEELKGKRVALQHGSASHFFFHLFLLRHRMTERDVTLVQKKFQELPDALARGEVDAFASSELFVQQAKEKLGGRGVVLFEERGLYGPIALLTGSRKYVRDNPDAVRSVLKGFIRAEEFARKRPAEAQGIVSRRMKLPQETIAGSWKDLNLAVQLPQSLLLALEEEARWAREIRLVDSKKLPNYLDFIDSDPLKSVRPRSVGIIR